ncbi:Mth938-like domain-containing protein [Thermococcus alcaliphilus]|uniref:Mth938-like domain-containing protein n=1 Tax=Thermococcus alcaliphilus TaxID=139207 RepID=UPI002091B47B|nr:Mth938-like domain-containing protein [Thermococcus alcaliphilus]MCO6041652.1 Mth938-like domain-containing protein [Thermococcus alcaliphilus]
MIDKVEFGRISVNRKEYSHDIVIYPSGKVERRKKWISKEKHGTSHKLDPEELKKYLKEDFEVLVVGTGIYGMLSLLPESRKLIEGKEVIEKPTPEAAKVFNELRKKRKTLGIFHITC